MFSISIKYESFTSATTEAATQITKKESFKMHIASFKHLVYKEFFDHDDIIILRHGQNPFQIYWLCTLFEEVKPDKESKQVDMLKKLSTGYLHWGKLSQYNSFVPHWGCRCFHCNIITNCNKVLMERHGNLEFQIQKAFGIHFDAMEVYIYVITRKKEIPLKYV